MSENWNLMQETFRVSDTPTGFCFDLSPVQLDVHGLLGETAQFVLFLTKTTTQSCFTCTDRKEIDDYD